MSGPVLASVAWLTGLLALLRFPIVTTGCAIAAVAWRWDPLAAWLVLAGTALMSLGWRMFGPAERLLPRCPALAVGLVAAAVALLAGGQAAGAALALVVLAVGWSLRAAPAPIARDRRSAPAAARSRRPVAPVGFLGAGALRVDFGPCPACGGVLVATGRTTDDPTRGPVLVAEATCTACAVQLVGLGDTTTGHVTWIDPDDGEARQ